MKANLGSARRTVGVLATGTAAVALVLAGAGAASAATKHAAVKPCHAGDVTLKLGRVDAGAGNRYAPLDITANKGVTCTLNGYASSYQFLAKDGSKMPTAAYQETGDPTANVQLGGGKVGHIVLHWAGIPADDEKGDQPDPAKLALKLPGDGKLATVAWTGGQTFQHGQLGHRSVQPGADGQ